MTDFLRNFDELGEMPLPPYIKEQLDDPDRYQTVYAKDWFGGSTNGRTCILQKNY